MADPLFAATRDASWHNHPDVRTPKMYHVIRNGDPLCGRGMLHDEGSETTLDSVPIYRRCTRNGCKQAWSARP